MSTTPQIRKDGCYMINVLGCVVIGICRSEGVQLKNKQANSNKPTLQTFACHLVSPQKGGSPAIPTTQEGHRSCSFPICLPYSDLLISSVLNLLLHLKSLGRQLLKQLRETGTLFNLSPPWVLNNKSHNFPCTQCEDWMPNPSSAAGVLFPGLSEDRKYHISISFDPFTLSVMLRCLYKSPFHCCHKDYKDPNR